MRECENTFAPSASTAAPEVERRACVCVWKIWIGVKLLTADVNNLLISSLPLGNRKLPMIMFTWRFSFHFRHTAGGRSVMVSLLPPKTLTIDVNTRLDQSRVPALLWLPVVQGLLPFSVQFLVMGRGSTQEPPRRFWNLWHCCRNLLRWERFGLFERDVSASNLFHLALAMAMVSFC